MGYTGIAKCVGILAGPSIGSLLFNLTDYSTTFLSFGIIIGLSAIAMTFLLPNSLNRKVDKSELED